MRNSGSPSVSDTRGGASARFNGCFWNWGVLNLTDSHWAYVKIIGEFSHNGVFSINFKKEIPGVSRNPDIWEADAYHRKLDFTPNDLQWGTDIETVISGIY